MRREHLAGLTAILFLCGVAARADEKGDAILRQAFAKLHAAKSFTADVTTTVSGPQNMTFKGTVAAKKPNYLRFALKGARAMTYVADGKSYYVYSNGAPMYVKQPLAPRPTAMMGMWEGEVDAFFGGAANAARVEADYAGTARVGGVACDLVKAKMRDPDRTVLYAIGKTDRLIRRATLTFPAQNGVSAKQTNLLTNIRLNAPRTAADFRFRPPKTAKLYEPPNYEAKLIAVGKDAPDFTLPTFAAGEVSLENTRKDKKAVLVDFWAYF